jgi:RimJ/RimL family protein N-acetyltransferase
VVTPPYRIVTSRLVIRCWEPRDAPLLKDALDTSLDHLQEWMPWARDEPKPLEEKAQLLRLFRGKFDLDQDYVYGLFSPDEREALGGSGLHTRVGDDAFEIGYWIRASATRQGIASETTAALTRVAFELCGVDRVELHIDPANEASLGVPRKLGFTEEATLRRRLPVARDMVVFALFRDEVPAPIAETALQAFDAAGARVL